MRALIERQWVFGQENLGHHAARAASPEPLDRVQRRHHEVPSGVERGELPDGERAVRAPGHHDEALPLRAGALEDVGGELVHLGEADGDHCAARRGEAGPQVLPGGGIGDCVEADDGKGRPHGQHDVGVVDGAA